LTAGSEIHIEEPDFLGTVSAAHGQEVRPVRDASRKKHDNLRIGRADHRHLVHLAPDERCLRAEIQPLNRQRLVHAVNCRAQNDQLLVVRVPVSVTLLALGVRQIRPQYHEQESRHQCSTGQTHKASRHDG
jgi:hypothetical protein